MKDMRRKEKEIKEPAAIEAIIQKATVCRLGLSEGQFPYVVPMCFGYQNSVVYLHGALQGRKIDIIKQNPNVCVEFESHAEIVKAERPCNWSMRYQSVIGFGKAELLQDLAEKRKALNVIMRQYYDRPFCFEDDYLKSAAVIRVEINCMTGKQSGF